MNTKLVIAWRNPQTRIWTPVASLEFKDNSYYFYYTNGAKEENFTAFGQMQDKSKTYVSDELFPIFKNRLLSKSRPEYSAYLKWLNIDESENNEFLELSRTRGIRATDQIQLFPVPEKTKDNKYEVLFFSHGISHISESYVERLKSLHKDDTLLLVKDIQNQIDSNALMIRTEEDPVELLGYCPAFFAKDINRLLVANGRNNVTIKVHQINDDAPLQLKLLCKLTTNWAENFKPFHDEEFQPYNID